MKEKKKKRGIGRILPIIGIIIGLCILAAYPALDIYYAFQHATEGRHIQRAVSSLSHEDYTEYERQAQEYNSALVTHQSPAGLWPYEKQLAVEGEGRPFAELVIPEISLDMPIYHGTSEETLMSGVGHLEGTSLPVGGESTHTVLTAHSGMSGMRAFDDIRQLKNGDIFLIRVLGKTLAYRVYDMEVLWPDEADKKVGIEEGKDLCTLITCTPYGVNDHRLLVNAQRVAYTPKMAKQRPSVQKVVTNRRYAPILCAMLLLLIMLIVGIVRKKKN